MEEVAHSRWGGSSADRWLNCAGSTALIATVPPKPSSHYAAEGTAAHKLAAICLAKDQHPREFLGVEMGAGFPVTEEMCDAVLVYLETVTHECAASKNAELYVEQGFVLDVPSAEPGEVFGTNDAMVYHPDTGRLVVFDYKHGVGYSVSADDNAQLKFYAAGAVFSHPEWKLSELHLVIVQPRAMDAVDDGHGLGVKWWTMDTLELLEFQGQVDEAIALAKAFGPDDILRPAMGYGEPFRTGSWCRWCDAAAVCPAKQAEILSTAQLDFADMTEITAADLPHPNHFDPERLGQILKAGKLLSDWLGQVQEYVEAIMLAGTPVPGWKVVEKIGRAKWVAADETVAEYAEMMFGVSQDAIFPRKLTTITEAEKLLKAAGATKDQIDDFKLACTIKESSGPTIAPESDRRPSINPMADFAGVQING